MPRNDLWADLDNEVLAAFRDGRARIANDVCRMLPDLTRFEVNHALDVNVQAGRLAAGESSYQITDAGRTHLERVPVGV